MKQVVNVLTCVRTTFQVFKTVQNYQHLMFAVSFFSRTTQRAGLVVRTLRSDWTDETLLTEETEEDSENEEHARNDEAWNVVVIAVIPIGRAGISYVRGVVHVHGEVL